MANRKGKDQEKLQRDVQDAWKEFTKDSKKAQEEITVIVVSGVLLTVAAGLLRWLLI